MFYDVKELVVFLKKNNVVVSDEKKVVKVIDDVLGEKVMSILIGDVDVIEVVFGLS